MITINLPEETIKTIIDVNEKSLVTNINKAYERLNNTNKSDTSITIKSMWANPTLARFLS